MKNIALMVLLLFGGFAGGRLAGLDSARAGQLAIALVFAFTGLGHFIKQDEMMAMLPPSLPARRIAVLLSGVVELIFAVTVMIPTYSKITGIAICVFLVLVMPVNVYSALKRVSFGGHGAGPKYLWVRIPLQFLLIAWTYWFAIHLN
jgi:uncharacterized membrane protein